MAFGVQHGAVQQNAVLSVAISPKGGGSTSPVVGTYTYTGGTAVSVTFTPSAGYAFDHWEVDGVSKGSANPISVTMGTLFAPANHLLVAIVVISATGGVIAGPGGTNIGLPAVNVSTSVKVTVAGDQSFTASVSTSKSVSTGGDVPMTVSPSTSKSVSTGGDVPMTVSPSTSFTTS